MLKRKPFKIGWKLKLLGVVLVALLLTFYANRYRQGLAFTLDGASESDIRQFAYDYVVNTGAVVEGTPEVLFARKVTADELRELGFNNFYFSCDRQLALAIYKGLFRSTWPGTQAMQMPYKQMAYIFDLEAAGMTAASGWPTGDEQFWRTLAQQPPARSNEPCVPGTATPARPLGSK